MKKPDAAPRSTEQKKLVKLFNPKSFGPRPDDLRGEQEDHHPPPNAAFLFYLLMTAQNCDALVGDLEERYKLIRKKFGRRRANFWYWTQTVMSLWPIAWAWAKKVVMKPVIGIVGWAVAKGLVGYDSWLALVELWKKVRS